MEVIDYEVQLSELRRKLWLIEPGEAVPRSLDLSVRRLARRAKRVGEIKWVRELRLLRGELLLKMQQYARAGKQFRLILRDDPMSVDAMIGIAKSYAKCGRISREREWFARARSVAEECECYNDLLFILDESASFAAIRSEWEEVSKLLGTMCTLLEIAPQIEHRLLLTAWLMSEMDMAKESLNFLECYARHVLRKDYRKSLIYGVARSLVEAYRKSGMTFEDAESAIQSLCAFASDAQAATIFADGGNTANRQFSPMEKTE